MALLTPKIRAQLIGNGTLQQSLREAGCEANFKPVAKLFMPDAAATWLLTELDPEDEDTAFGLCDLGLGCPELGTVSIRELERLRGKLGLPVEIDIHFSASKDIGEYAVEARREGRISA